MSESFHVCVVQPQGYPHSLAFAELAELICYAISDLGHSCGSGVNALNRGARNILIGAHLLGESARARIPASSIILNTEQLGASQHPWTETVIELATRLELWDYSPVNLEYLQARGMPRGRLLELGFHPKLARLRTDIPADIDVLFYGSIGPRRQCILKALEARGLKVKALFGVYGEERDRWIERSKLILNCHHYDTGIFEVVRVFYLLTNARAVVAEVGDSTHIDRVFLDAVCAVPYSGLVDACERLACDERTRVELGQRGRQVIESRPQTDLMKHLVN